LALALALQPAALGAQAGAPGGGGAARPGARPNRPARLVRAPDRALAARLNRLLDEAPFERALWGVAVLDPEGRLVYERNGERLFIPASNTKLIVAAAAAALLPADYRYRTSVYAAGPVVGGVVRGDLVLYGRGDPTLSGRYAPSRFSAFDELADSLSARGITRVEGDLVGDASHFDSVVVHPSWETYDVNWWYAAPVTALGFNDNAVDFQIAPGPVGQPPFISFEPDLGLVRFANRARTVPADSPRTFDFYRRPGTNDLWAEGDLPAGARPWQDYLAVVDAPLWAATAFRRSLQSRGITVAGATRGTYDPAAYAAARRQGPLAERRSRALPDILAPILEQSQNWFAELLLKTLGKELTGAGSWRAGLAVERRFLIDSLGLDSTMFSLEDASGLSHHNLATPVSFVQLLRAMRERSAGQRFVDALPQPGRSGTLRSRFRASRPAGLVRAKTGSIGNVNTLTGYLDTAEGYWTFSIQINNHAAQNREALRRIDAVVAAIGR
jgi:D-alanyl-D-alanine carboxypeptidase/D-alanyl-D-alanine-endopeptidase (penicillin-binding protein 4)